MGRSVGSRAVRASKPVQPKLTPTDIQTLRDQGHQVVDQGDGTVNVVGTGIFRLIGGRREVAHDNIGSGSVVVESESVHSGMADFSVVSESSRVHGGF